MVSISIRSARDVLCQLTVTRYLKSYCLQTHQQFNIQMINNSWALDNSSLQGSFIGVPFLSVFSILSLFIRSTAVRKMSWQECCQLSLPTQRQIVQSAVPFFEPLTILLFLSRLESLSFVHCTSTENLILPYSCTDVVDLIGGDFQGVMRIICIESKFKSLRLGNGKFAVQMKASKNLFLSRMDL